MFVPVNDARATEKLQKMVRSSIRLKHSNIIFGDAKNNSDPKLVYKLHQSILEQCNVVKYLGAYLTNSNNLKCDHHVPHVVTETVKALYYAPEKV